ncbi:MAG: hypothetical protein AB7L09_00185 [Nitrospira sp.]
MRRHRLVSLEKAGLVLEYYGYSGNFASTTVDDIPPSSDADEDERLRVYMLRKAREEAIARQRRMKRLRQLARMDFKMIGGVAPVGFYGGAGGGGANSRPTSMSARG